MRSITAAARITAAAALLASLGLGAGCSSPPPPAGAAESSAPSAPSAPSESASPAAAPTPPGAVSAGPQGSQASAPVPAAGSDEPRARASSAPTRVNAGPDPGIVPSTKRSAAGLPDPLLDYLSWLPLEKCASPPAEASRVHLPFRKAYAAFPKAEPALPPPAGTILLLEEKDAGRDFISRVGAMARDEKGWRFSAYARTYSTEPFAAAAATQCEACHSKAKDSVYSRWPLPEPAPQPQGSSPATGGSPR